MHFRFIAKFLVISIVILLNACYRYHVVRDYKAELKPLGNKDRIALVGFYPYRYQTIYAGSHAVVVITDLDYKNPTSGYFSEVKRIEEFPVKGIDPSVPSETLKQLVDNYRSLVGFYGDLELRKLIQWTGEPGVESYAFKKRDVDYYILATHGPENDEQNYGNSFRFLISIPFSILTFGTIPVWGTRDVESHFFIYDKRMNLVAKKEYKNKYTVFGAWWGRKEEGMLFRELPDTFRASLYKPDVESFVDFFPSTLPPTKK
jgi:hypothetical protein